jgi:hypothetical protein
MLMSDRQREENLDAIRGACVLAMTVHHCINYFPGYSLSYWRFVSGAFPFLAGFLVTSILVGRANVSSDGDRLGSCLLFRGLKLIVLCIALNIILTFIFPLDGKAESNSVLDFIGNVGFYGNYKSVAFSLLIPIGYTIALSGILLLFRMMHLRAVAILGCALFIYCALAEWLTRREYYIPLVSIGVFGMATGYASAWINHNLLNKAQLAIAPWFVMQTVIAVIGKGEPYLIYCANTVASLLLIGFLVRLAVQRRFAVHYLIVLGQYSLLLYLFQIAALVVLKVQFNKLPIGSGVAGFWMALWLVGSIQLCLAAGTDWYRKRHPFTNRVYRWVFH